MTESDVKCIGLTIKLSLLLFHHIAVFQEIPFRLLLLSSTFLGGALRLFGKKININSFPRQDKNSRDIAQHFFFVLSNHVM